MSVKLPRVKGGFRIIHCDPPWRFKSNSESDPGRNPMRHYECMNLADLCDLPVRHVAAHEALLALWVPTPLLVVGKHLGIIKEWGFKPSGFGFVWIKTNSGTVEGQPITDKDLFTGLGFTTRKNCEVVVFANRGRSVRKDAGVHEIIMAPAREHSRKPDEVYRRLERYADGPYLDMFGRQSRPGWTVWGDQATKFDGEAGSNGNCKTATEGDL